LMVPPAYLVVSGASKDVTLDIRIDKMWSISAVRISALYAARMMDEELVGVLIILIVMNSPRLVVCQC
jgi:hypothetical protein